MSPPKEEEEENPGEFEREVLDTNRRKERLVFKDFLRDRKRNCVQLAIER